MEASPRFSNDHVSIPYLSPPEQIYSTLTYDSRPYSAPTTLEYDLPQKGNFEVYHSVQCEAPLPKHPVLVVVPVEPTPTPSASVTTESQSARVVIPEVLSAQKKDSYLQSIKSHHIQLPVPENINWNEEFQRALSKPSSTVAERLERASAIRQLSLRFVRSANLIGKTIISEYSLKNTQKSIQALAGAGGIAGGAKYLYSNIFFKFPDDSHNLYGGDTFAMKSASHEAKGIKMYLGTDVVGLHVPLMTCIDYKGRRLIASSVLPIGSDTLIYGSNDAAATVLTSDSTFNQLMIKAAEKLNLKGHMVGRSSEEKMLHAPADIEGHRGTDGRFYIVDTARVFPPEATKPFVTAVLIPANEELPITAPQLTRQPLSALTEDISAVLNHCSSPVRVALPFEGQLWSEGISQRNARARSFCSREVLGDALYLLNTRGFHLYNMLRPEIVLSSPVPLSSDAFSGFGLHDRQAHNEEVRKQSDHLLQKVIPELASRLEKKLFVPVHVFDLTNEMHSLGINVRHLGWLRANLYDEGIRTLTLLAMSARIAKTLLRTHLRSVVSASDSDFKDSICDYFNMLLGNSTASLQFWRSDVKVHLLAKFDSSALSDAEMLSTCNLRDAFSITNLFQVLQTAVGVFFHSEVTDRSQQENFFTCTNPFKPSDIKELSSKARPIHSDTQLLELLRAYASENTTDLRESAKRYHKAVKNTFGVASIEHAQSWLRLAEQELSAKQFQAALKYIEKAMFVFRQKTIPLDLGIMASYIIANVYFQLQYIEQAEAILESNIKVLEKLGCESHFYYLLSLNLLIECQLANSKESDKTLVQKFFNAWKRNPFPGNAELRRKLFHREVPAGLSKCVEQLGLVVDNFLQNEDVVSSAHVSEWLAAASGLNRRSGGDVSAVVLSAASFQFDLNKVLMSASSARSSSVQSQSELKDGKPKHSAYVSGVLLLGNQSLNVASIAQPSPLEFFSEQKRVACVTGSKRAMYAILTDGSVWSWGEGIAALGHPGCQPRKEPTLLQSLKMHKIVSIECGGMEGSEFALFLSSGGDVLSVGCGSYGKLGHGDRITRSTPRLITALHLERVVQIAVGHDHAAALDSRGVLWTWGCNLTGQCGILTVPVVLLPTQISGINTSLVGTVKYIAATLHQTVALTKSGRLFYWGKHFIPLTHFEERGKVPYYTDTPKMLPWPEYSHTPILATVSMGRSHLVCLDEKGQVWSIGSNDSGQLGVGDQNKRVGLARVDFGGKKIRSVQAANNYSMAVTDTGDVFHWGTGPPPSTATRPMPVHLSELRQYRFAAVFTQPSFFAVCSESIQTAPEEPQGRKTVPEGKIVVAIDNTQPVTDSPISLQYHLANYPNGDLIRVRSVAAPHTVLFQRYLPSSCTFSGTLQFPGQNTKELTRYEVLHLSSSATQLETKVLEFEVEANFQPKSLSIEDDKMRELITKPSFVTTEFPRLIERGLLSRLFDLWSFDRVPFLSYALRLHKEALLSAIPADVDLTLVLNSFGGNGSKWTWELISAVKPSLRFLDMLIARGWNPSIRMSHDLPPMIFFNTVEQVEYLLSKNGNVSGALYRRDDPSIRPEEQIQFMHRILSMQNSSMQDTIRKKLIRLLCENPTCHENPTAWAYVLNLATADTFSMVLQHVRDIKTVVFYPPGNQHLVSAMLHVKKYHNARELLNRNIPLYYPDALDPLSTAVVCLAGTQSDKAQVLELLEQMMLMGGDPSYLNRVNNQSAEELAVSKSVKEAIEIFDRYKKLKAKATA